MARANPFINLCLSMLFIESCIAPPKPKKRSPSIFPRLPGFKEDLIKYYYFPNFCASQEISGSDYPRPKWANSIMIATDKKRRYQLLGTIVPVKVGKRDETVGATPSKTFNGAASGHGTGLERGHVLALRLGGPNAALNIAAQTAGWQGGGGEWYKLETRMFDFAMKCYGWKEVPSYVKAKAKHTPTRLCNIDLQITQWQGEKLDVPKKYEILMSCCGPRKPYDRFWRILGYETCKKRFDIYQPMPKYQEPVHIIDNPERQRFVTICVSCFVLMLVIAFMVSAMTGSKHGHLRGS